MRGPLTLSTLQLEALDRAGGRLGDEQLEGLQQPEDPEDSNEARQPRRLPTLESLDGGKADSRLVSELSLGEIAFEPGPPQPAPELDEYRLVC